MINLIPNEDKKVMAKEFYLRLSIVVIFVVDFCILFASVALLPSYYMSSLQRNFISEKLDLQKKEPEPTINPKTSSIIKDLDSKLSLIEKSEQSKYLISEKVINEIILKKMSDIKIQEISYKNDPLLGRSINILGIAPSRERLLLFRRVLEDDVSFKKVDLPISNFVKGTDISFFLNLIPS